MSDKPKQAQTPNVKLTSLTPQERGAINILTPEERKQALLQAAREKAALMFPSDERRTA